MKKAVLISIQPKWCELIASGKKTVEVRKTKPKLETPFKVYIYCTMPPRGRLHMYDAFGFGNNAYDYGGKVIGEFVCDWVIGTCPWRVKGKTGLCAKRTEKETNFPNMSCLTLEEIEKYAGSEGRGIYGWHISDLVIYDKPRELSEFYRECEQYECDNCPYLYVENTPNCYETWCEVDGKITLKRPPQSWCYVEEVSDEQAD